MTGNRSAYWARRSRPLTPAALERWREGSRAVEEARRAAEAQEAARIAQDAPHAALARYRAAADARGARRVMVTLGPEPVRDLRKRRPPRSDTPS